MLFADKHKFKVGDRVIEKHRNGLGNIAQGIVVREILLNYDDGTYLWCYTDVEKTSSNVFDSKNSSDPFLSKWKLKKTNPS